MATIRKRSWKSGDEAKTSWICDYFDSGGKRRQRTFRTKKEADAWLVKARHEVASGTHTADSASVTIAEAADLWLTRCERDGLEQSTLTGYRSLVKHHVLPLLGATKLSRLTRPIVEQFVDEMLETGRTRETARRSVQTLVSAIGEAERRGLVAQNVARGVRVATGKRHKPKVAIPTKDEVREALAGTQGRQRAVLTAVVFTGLRASELRGLRWADVDFGRKLILVRQRADTSGRVGALKSAGSRRDIPMVPMLLNVLKEWRLASPGGDLDLVFAGRGDRPLCHNTVMALLGGRAHPYRHWFASWLIDQGFGPKRVQALMGHSSIGITFDIYGHLFPQEDDHDRFAAGELALVSG